MLAIPEELSKIDPLKELLLTFVKLAPLPVNLTTRPKKSRIKY
jgi:hypothetical protein